MSINPSTPEPLNRCVRIKKNGERCKRLANNGTTVCNSHGARAPQIRAKAQTRLLMSADKLMGALLKIALNEKLPVQHRLVAIRDGLDRANLGAKTQIELDVSTDRPKSFEELAMGALVDVAQTDDGDWFVAYQDGTHKVLPAGTVSDHVVQDMELRNDPNVIDAEVIEDDAPLVPREPDVQNRFDRAAFAEVERSRQSRVRPGGMTAEQRKRAEDAALADVRAGQSAEDEAERIRQHEAMLIAKANGTWNGSSRGEAMREAAARTERSGKRRARTSEATITDAQGERRRRK